MCHIFENAEGDFKCSRGKIRSIEVKDKLIGLI